LVVVLAVLSVVLARCGAALARNGPDLTITKLELDGVSKTSDNPGRTTGRRMPPP
jgi:hypothetical protein